MTDTRTLRQLLIVALQDLRDAKSAWIRRLPELGLKSGRLLGHFVSEERVRAARQRAVFDHLLDALDASPDGMPNIWLNAILEDAERDSETIAEGPLRDIALTGAFRKGKQSERVSDETAIGLAKSLDEREAAETVTRIRDAEASADGNLADILEQLLRDLGDRSA